MVGHCTNLWHWRRHPLLGHVLFLFVLGPNETLQGGIGLRSSESVRQLSLVDCPRPAVSHVLQTGHLQKYIIDFIRPTMFSNVLNGLSSRTCSGDQVSKFTDLTRVMCTPRLRWIPAHRMHKNTPRFHDAHRGPVNGIGDVLSSVTQEEGGSNFSSSTSLVVIPLTLCIAIHAVFVVLILEHSLGSI